MGVRNSTDASWSNEREYNLELRFREPPWIFMSVKNHILSGITAAQWIKLLVRWKYDIDWSWYTHRIIFLTIMSVINSVVALWEEFMYGKSIKAVQLTDLLPPIFILGHPRTGTTHLHNLLAQDGRFIFASTFDVGFPSGCVSLDCDTVKDVLRPILDKTRPMDNMTLDWELPQEDELAVNQLTGGTSPYMSIVFIKSKEKVDDLYTLERNQHSRKAWVDAFLTFLKKITFKWKVRNRDLPRGKHLKPRLLIKSPVHTARIPLLLKLFPNAKFIYIHRHPVQVIQSAAHMANTYYWYSALQRPDDAATERFIMDQFVLLNRQYVRDRHLIAKENLIEVEFSALDSDPIRTINTIYDFFELGDFAKRMEPRLREYIEANNLNNFKKNAHVPLSNFCIKEIRRACPEAFDLFNYK